MSTPVSKSNLFKSWMTAQTRSDKNVIADDKSLIQTFRDYKKSDDRAYANAIKAEPQRKDEFERDRRAADATLGRMIKGEQGKLTKDEARLSSLGKVTPNTMTSNKDFQSWLGGQIGSTEGRISLEKQQIQTIQNDHLGGTALQEVEQRLTADEATLKGLEKFRG